MSVEIKKFKINTLLNRYPYLPASNVQNELSSFNHFSVPKIAAELQLFGLKVGMGDPKFSRPESYSSAAIPKSLHEVDVGREYEGKNIYLIDKDSTLKIVYQFQYLYLSLITIPFAINKISSPLLVIMEDLLSKINVHLSIRVR